jgi:hypothetical protein
VDGVRVDDPRKEMPTNKRGEFSLRAGKKKFLKVVIE